jgi:hypothetical protein
MIGYDLRLKILIKEQVLSDSLSLAEFVVKPGEFKKVPFVEPKVNYMLKITSGSEIYVLHGNRARRWVSLTFTPVVMFELYEDKTRKLIDWN